ncbi:TPA: restriction endonuclease subunit S [Streptococcus suis]|nr:restriction endonuclease subunit S [Streptococcus suis]
MKTNNNIPAYRFQGYTDAWELRKLGEVAEINPKSQIPEKFEYVDLESVVGTSLISHRTVRAESAPSRAQRLALPGDIFYQTVRPYQKNNYLFDLSDDNYVFSTGYAQLRPKIDDRYLMIKIQDDGFVKEVLDRCTGTSYPAINSKDLSQISIDVPTSLPEQEAIGTFFSTLDRHITLHQRKLDTLKEQKKTYLKLLFPDKGQTKPALRFQGFEDDWEEVKFGDLWKHTSEKNSELNYSSKDIISVAKMQQGKISKDSTDEYMKTYNILRYGDIAFEGNKSKEFSFGRFVYNDFKTGIVSHVFITFSPKVNMSSKFMKIFINNENIMKYELAKATTKTLMMTTLNVADMNKRRLRLPTLPEQEAIGTFFQTLDQEIAQVEDKLASLKEMKKTLLRKLFV